jgi:uridine kinase
LNAPTVLGIAGGSGSGKSTVMRRVIEAVGAFNVAVLDHDRYYFDLKHLSAEERAKVNFDHPSSLETTLLCRHLDELIAGRAIEKPIYDFSRHTRTEETERVEPRPLIIVEGILVLAEPELVRRMDLRVFVDADDDIRLSRRIRRDIEERGRTLDSVLVQYETTVRPMHLAFVAPSRHEADLVIPRGGYNEIAIGVLASHLRSRVLGF